MAARRGARALPRRRAGWWLAAALALLGAARPVPAQRAALERVIQSRTLANGLEVIVIENHAVPIVTVEVDVRNGAFIQTPELEGLPHLYEHMFFKANANFPERDGVMNRASELGAVFNAETQEERVNYYLTLPSANLEPALRLLNSALRSPLFLPEELLSEKHVVLGEYDRAEASPFWHLDQAMLRALYPGYFGRKNTIGDRAVIAAVTPQRMREIQRLYYHPNNAALIVAGDADPAQAFALAERIFGDWPRGPDPFAARPVPPVPPLRSDTAVIVEQPVNGLSVLVQWQGPSVGADEAATFAADVFSDYLNREGSRFQRRLVDSGLWQGVLVNYYTLNHAGPITVSGQTTPERFREAMAALVRELDATRDPAYFTADELEEVKAKRAVETAFGMERTSGFAHTVGFWWSVHSLDYLLRYVDAMAAQTPQDLVRYATRYIHDRPRVVGVLLAPADRARLRLTPAELVRLGRGAAR